MVRERERQALERAVDAVARQVDASSAIVDEAIEEGSEDIVLNAKILRLELLRVKGDLERELGRLVLDCTDCGRTVHWVSGLGAEPGHWAHREPAPHDAPSCGIWPTEQVGHAQRTYSVLAGSADTHGRLGHPSFNRDETRGDPSRVRSAEVA
jgi:hypothetical protein